MIQFLKEKLPSRKELMTHKSLQRFRHLMRREHLWKFNREKVARAFAVGLFAAFIPLPLQMLLAAIGAIYFEANLPVSIALVWVTNPVTMPAIFYGCYHTGVWILGDVEKIVSDDMVHNLTVIWPPFLLGSLVLAIVASLLGYGFVILFWRLLRR